MSNPNDRNKTTNINVDGGGSNWVLPAIIVAALLGVAIYYFMGSTTPPTSNTNVTIEQPATPAAPAPAPSTEAPATPAAPAAPAEPVAPATPAPAAPATNP